MVSKRPNSFWRFCALLISIFIGGAGAAAQPPDDCSWRYAGSDRAAVKNRSRRQRNYTEVNRGRPITVEDWYDLVCPFGSRVPPKSEISERRPIPGLETRKVTLRGFVLTAKFERAEDHDIHAEIAGSREWRGRHVIVEIPAGAGFCQIRKTLWNMVRADRLREGLTGETSEWHFKHPPEVLITGFLFLDAHHLSLTLKPGDICKHDGGRGSRVSGESRVNGLWEIHPVTSITPVSRRRNHQLITGRDSEGSTGSSTGGRSDFCGLDLGGPAVHLGRSVLSPLRHHTREY